MKDVHPIYCSIQVCHKIFVHTYSRNFLVLGIVASIMVFVMSAFQLIMLHSEENYILIFVFSCGFVISTLVLINICRFAKKLSDSSQILLQVLFQKLNNEREKLILQSYMTLQIPYSVFFTFKRHTMLRVGGLSMDILITWILGYIQSNEK